MMQGNKGLHTVTWILVIVGGLNWLLVGFGWDLVMAIFGSFARFIYILVGLSAIYEIAIHGGSCKLCDKGMAAKPTTGSTPMNNMGM